MVTVTLQIGNTDSKLSQEEWHRFVYEVDAEVQGRCVRIHFHGGPPTYAPIQNSAWVADCETVHIQSLKDSLTQLRRRYRQSSLAFTAGTTEFI